MTSPALSYRDDPDVPAFPDDKPMIVFDDVCRLCPAGARFVPSHDEAGRFRGTAAQSPVVQALDRPLRLPPADDTFLVEDGHVGFSSDAALRVAGRLGLPWSPPAGLLGIVPRAAGDTAYDIVAKDRDRFFGRRETGLLPTADHAGRLL